MKIIFDEKHDRIHISPSGKKRKDVTGSSISFPGWKESLTETYNNCLASKAENKFYLFSIDPGLGKTNKTIEYLRRYKASGFSAGGSVLILVSRTKEIENYISGCELDEDDYAVVVSDPILKAKGLGYQNANHARVLFSTQQMMFEKTGKGNLEHLHSFHYKNRPRSLRIWDESLVPAEHITLRLDVLDSLAADLRSIVSGFISRDVTPVFSSTWS